MIGLVSCTKAKLDRPAPAGELYAPSALFRGARCYVERSCDRWFILSAKHGLVAPDRELEPYDQTLNDAGRAERKEWASGVLGELVDEFGDLRGQVFQVHAGSAYLRFGLLEGLLRAGAEVEDPAEGLSFGRRLAFYKNAGCL
jgi:hypothetical protein